MFDALLTSVVHKSEWSASRPGCFTLGTAPTVIAGDWADLTAGLSSLEKRKHIVASVGKRMKKNLTF
jgi:hypothetical protein